MEKLSVLLNPTYLTSRTDGELLAISRDVINATDSIMTNIGVLYRAGSIESRGAKRLMEQHTKFEAVLLMCKKIGLARDGWND